VGLSRFHIQRAVEASLRRLRTDVIDLYQTHFPDPHTPIDETLRALDDLVRAGKVRYVGCSNYPLFRLAEADRRARELGLTRYETLQPRYNLLYREIETELLPYARQEQLGVIVYNPIAGGLLSGKYRAGEAPRAGTRFTIRGAGEIYRQRYWDEAQLVAVAELAKEVEARGLALAAVAVAWVIAQPGVTSAIIGASRPEQLDATWQAPSSRSMPGSTGGLAAPCRPARGRATARLAADLCRPHRSAHRSVARAFTPALPGMAVALAPLGFDHPRRGSIPCVSRSSLHYSVAGQRAQQASSFP
jgi:aryl-alcohol dehydrogenase-like predicted oxidoreductase